MSDSEIEAQGESPFGDQLKQAFKKRLKLTRLNHESKLGYGPMTKGNSRNSGIVAITPPNQFPEAVWDELTRQGKLKHVGQGLYDLTSGTSLWGLAPHG